MKKVIILFATIFSITLITSCGSKSGHRKTTNGAHVVTDDKYKIIKVIECDSNTIDAYGCEVQKNNFYFLTKNNILPIIGNYIELSQTLDLYLMEHECDTNTITNMVLLDRKIADPISYKPGTSPVSGIVRVVLYSSEQYEFFPYNTGRDIVIARKKR